MLGLTVADPDTPALSQADVDGLATWVAMRMQMGPDAADGFLRVLGANVARVAEAISSMIRTSQPKMWLGHTGDELTTAQVYRDAAEFVPRLGAMIDAVHRQHLVSTRTFIEGVVSGPSASLVCGVGFADLSGFTALTQTLTPAELSAMLTEFGATVSDVVHADGGRVVKFLGDAVMWVSSEPGAAGAKRQSTSSTIRAHAKRACRSAPVSVTARSWPSTVITSATRSTWPPGSSPRRRRGRSSPQPTSTSYYRSGPPSSRNHCSSRVSTLR